MDFPRNIAAPGFDQLGFLDQFRGVETTLGFPYLVVILCNFHISESTFGSRFVNFD